ncbi:MBL fold metallo-hydrolase, partial [Staphylococcus epidermidis]
CLSHLSQDNNRKELGRMSVGQVLNEHDIDTEKEVLLCDTDKAIPTPIYTI